MKKKNTNVKYFIVYCLASFSLKLTYNHFIVTEEIILEDYFQGGGSWDAGQEWLKFQSNLNLIEYVLIPLIGIKILILEYLTKFTATFYKLDFDANKVSKILITSEMVFLSPIAINIIWFCTLENYDMKDLSDFEPLSIKFLFDGYQYTSLIDRFCYGYIFEKLSLVEVAYLVILFKQLDSHFDDAGKLMLIPYGIWLVSNVLLRLLVIAYFN